MATKKKVSKVKKPAAKKPAAKATAKKAAAKKPAAKKATAKKAPKAKKAPAKKAPAKKVSKKTATKVASKKPAKTAAAKAKVAAKPKVEKKPKVEIPKKPVLLTPKNKSSLQYTQSELYDCLTGYCGFTSKKDAKVFYEQFTAMLQGALKNGYRVVLPGLGKIQVRKTKARTGINPQTREPIKIPARKKVRFTPNKALKDAVL